MIKIVITVVVLAGALNLSLADGYGSSYGGYGGGGYKGGYSGGGYNGGGYNGGYSAGGFGGGVVSGGWGGNFKGGYSGYGGGSSYGGGYGGGKGGKGKDKDDTAIYIPYPVELPATPAYLEDSNTGLFGSNQSGLFGGGSARSNWLWFGLLFLLIPLLLNNNSG